MENKEELKTLEDYLNGQSDREVTAWVTKLFSEGENNAKLRRQLYNEWGKGQEDKSLEGDNLQPVLDRLHHVIQLDDLEKRQKPLRRIVRGYMKIAAILLLPVIIAGTFLFSYTGWSDRNESGSLHDATIYAPMGSRVAFNLPDGTSGMLNSGSYLSYSVPFNGRRQVTLSGEAWFEVKSDPENPFQISAGKSTIKVTGTKFNLGVYPSENYVELVLDEGEIEFKADSLEEFVIMNPSERLVVLNGEMSRSTVDPEKYSAWTDGKLVFKNDTMAEVVRRLERWYNVNISLADEELEKYSFRATFQDDSVEEVLKFLALTSPIGYKITPRSLTPDGSYRKQEIIIYKEE